jgi:hypothetical protein
MESKLFLSPPPARAKRVAVQQNGKDPMKLPTLLVIGALIASSSSIAFAQNGDQQSPAGPRRPGGPDAGRRLPPPLLAALDLNHDGIISADEITKAPESLKKLDKNGDGQLTRDELRPPRRPGGPRQNEAPQHDRED